MKTFKEFLNESKADSLKHKFNKMMFWNKDKTPAELKVQIKKLAKEDPDFLLQVYTADVKSNDPRPEKSENDLRHKLMKHELTKLGML